MWNFTVLGEAAAQMPEDLKARHPDVGWVQPTRLRNRIVHGCWSVDVKLLHDVATQDLAELVDQLSAVREASESGPDV